MACKKDSFYEPQGETLPFEDEYIRVTKVADSLPYYFNSMHFFDAQNGIALQGTGAIYTTTNGGQSWDLRYDYQSTLDSSDYYFPFYDMLMTDATIGYVIGDSVILKTTDRGEHWQPIFTSHGYTLRSICKISPTELYCTANNQLDAKRHILKSTDAGMTWTIDHEADFMLGRIRAINNKIYCIGSHAKMLVKEVGGTWQLTQLDSLTGSYLTDIGFSDDSSVGYIATNSNVIFQSTNNGNQWQDTGKSSFRFSTVDVLTQDFCLLTGSGWYSGGDWGYTYAAMRYTPDRGDTWHEYNFLYNSQTSSTAFYSASEGYVAAGTKLLHIKIKYQ